tara:strand:- start:18 stop:1211 length:1194 start_codon:yes stop_codon:yes gene_type:complete
MSEFKTIDDLDVAEKRILVRVDLNVPMVNGRVINTTRIDRIVPTLSELSKKGGKVIIISHFGRPEGQVVPGMSLSPVARALSKSCGLHIEFATDTIGNSAKEKINGMKSGEIIMLENLRFDSGEEANDEAFASKLSQFGDAFVSDAFSCSHRAHASTVGLAQLLPSASGRLMQAELESLSNILQNPTLPIAAIVGGAKVSTKMEVLGNLSEKVDLLIIGGGMANTFFLAQGYDVGRSFCERDMVECAYNILVEAKRNGCEVILPIDCVVAKKLEKGAKSQTVGPGLIPYDSMVLDIGNASIANIAAKLKQCKTLVWNGPLGAFEVQPFDRGTNVIADVVVRLTKERKIISVAGGGDTVAALAHASADDSFSYISTAGGAFLDWLEGKKLPGVEVLRK